MERTVGECVRAWRTARGLTQGQVSIKSGVSEKTLRRWENGQYELRLPDLELVLTALGATPEQKTAAVMLMDRPRAVRHLRAQEIGMQTEFVGPASGDLWRALRERRGLTREQVADALRISEAKVTRWERTEGLPPQDHLDDLFALLGAWPEEREALTCPQAQDARAGRDASLDECEHQSLLLARAVDNWPCPLADLGFHALERRLARLAAEGRRAQEVIGRTLDWHSQCLQVAGRYAEGKKMTDSVLTWWQAHRRKPPFSHLAVYHRAFYLARAKRHGAKADAIAHLQQHLSPAIPPEIRSGFYRDMACWEAQRGDAHSFRCLMKCAYEEAARSEQRESQRVVRFVHAQALLALGQPGKALDIYPEQASDGPSDWQIRLFRAKALLRLNKKAEAQDELAAFYRLIERHQVMHHKEQGDALAARL